MAPASAAAATVLAVDKPSLTLSAFLIWFINSGLLVTAFILSGPPVTIFSAAEYAFLIFLGVLAPISTISVASPVLFNVCDKSTKAELEFFSVFDTLLILPGTVAVLASLSKVRVLFVVFATPWNKGPRLFFNAFPPGISLTMFIAPFDMPKNGSRFFASLPKLRKLPPALNVLTAVDPALTVAPPALKAPLPLHPSHFSSG